MSNQNPAFPALVSLALTPSLHYEEFCTGLHEIASTLCTQHYPRGLLTNYVTHTPNQFNALGLTIPDPDPNAAPEATLPAPYPTLPVKPTHPVGPAATNATLSLFRLQDTLYIDVTQGITAIRAHALAFLGETITTELRGLPGGLTAQGLPEILAYLEHEYGTPTEYDLRTLFASLNCKFSVASSFRADAANMRRTFAKLAQCGQPVPEHSKMEYLQKATDLFEPIVSCIHEYKRLNPGLLTRSFNAMTAYIIVYAPLRNALDLGYVGSTEAHLTPPPADANTLSSSDIGAVRTLLQHFAGAATLPPTPLIPSQRTRGGGGGGTKLKPILTPTPAAAPTPPTASRNSWYCFAHGYRGHWGTDCQFMASSPLCNDAMRRATAPCVINNHQGHA